MSSEAKRGRGRPVTTDPVEVGLTALRLFVEKGIDKVTMDDVAIAAGISRSNLFRVFPSKAAVVWGGVERFNAALTHALENSTETSLVRTLHKSWVDAMHIIDNSLETVRLRLKLIASSPEVYGWGAGQLELSRKVLEHYIAQREGAGVRAKMISSALMAASVSVLTWWAETDDPRHPSEVLDESFAQFEQIFAEVN
ncbi:MAG: TetR family transcriptional regulator [Actinobacteria bacterium]|nr:TetR family transcriptional regulator [Actinomycetota bacterium]